MADMIIISIYRRENQGSERLGNWPEVTQPGSARTRRSDWESGVDPFTLLSLPSCLPSLGKVSSSPETDQSRPDALLLPFYLKGNPFQVQHFTVYSEKHHNEGIQCSANRTQAAWAGSLLCVDT